ncbi:MAG TPA: DUF4330 domain-containing protein [Firmicutes bacterium]|nr:DUF4330 domain-containing protein [Bacillota bacterium]
MRLLDEKGRLFGLINIIDLLVLILVIAVVAGGAYHFTRPQRAGQPGTGGKKVVVLALVSNVSQYTVDAVQVGSTVFDPTAKSHLGKIIALEVTPHKEPVETADGRVVLADVPERFDMLVTWEGYASVTDKAVAIASYELRVGSTVVLGNRDFMVSTTVLKVDIED